MATIALVNPKRRRRRKSSGRRKMTAKQLQYFGKRRSRRHSRRSVAAASPRRRRRRASLGRRVRRSARRFARHTGGGVSLRGMNFNSFLKGTLIPSAVGAAGALGVDLMLGYATPYLPTMLTSGPAVPLTKIAAAVGLGMIAQGVTKDRNMAEHVMAGAITVVAYQWIRDMAKAQFPTLPLSEYVSGMGYAGPAMAFPGPDAQMQRGMGVYVGTAAPWNPSIATRVGGGATRVVQPPGSRGMNGMGWAGEYEESGYSYR
jgi:hypothetical protein